LPTSPREQLGSRLRDLRLRAGLSGDALATRLGLTQSKVSRVETGRSLPNLDEVRKWAAATQASDQELRELASLVEQVATTTVSWRILHQLGLAEKQREIAELEREAVVIRVFQPTMVPGLLQIAEYARRVIGIGYTAGQSDIAQAVRERMERQTILYNVEKSFEFIITQAALMWGWDDLRAAQLDRIRSIASMPNVELGVILAGARSLPLLHPFVLFELEGETLVSVETYSAELRVRDEEDIARYRDIWTEFKSGCVPIDRLVL
jgi:transcriptional regulator with XRE-family HTH domain